MERAHFPEFGTGANTFFKDYGFLSAQGDRNRKSRNGKGRGEMAAMKASVLSSHADSSLLVGIRIPNVEQQPLAFRERMLESCQGAVILADCGMVPSGASVLRTAWECLFYGCAIWNDKTGTLIEQLKATEERQRKVTAYWLGKRFKKKEVSPEVWEAIQRFSKAPDPVLSELSIVTVAKRAGMAQAYASVYAELSKIGTHATLSSLNPYAPTGPLGDRKRIVGPNFDGDELIYRGAMMCMKLGQERFREHFSHLTFGPPIPG